MKGRPLFFCLLLELCAGCAPQRDTRCEQIADEVRGLLEGCGVTFHDYQDELGSQCTGELEEIYECLFVCYESSSCAAFEVTDTEASQAFRTCVGSCLAPPQ